MKMMNTIPVIIINSKEENNFQKFKSLIQFQSTSTTAFYLGRMDTLPLLPLKKVYGFTTMEIQN